MFGEASKSTIDKSLPALPTPLIKSVDTLFILVSTLSILKQIQTQPKVWFTAYCRAENIFCMEPICSSDIGLFLSYYIGLLRID
jgi:hypothetical protein